MSKVKGKEYELAVRIAGVIDKNFDVSLQAAAAKARGFAGTIDSMDKGFSKISSAAKKSFDFIAKAAGVATVAVGGLAAAATKVGSDFESAFAGVKKTVDETAAEVVGGYDALRKDILDMSLEIPQAATEIAGAMEIAGQLGIDPEALSDFTKTMIMIGTSTNLEAEEAATALARFANITNMANYGEDGVSNFERLGSAVVDLGNNFATTEEEIVRLATNLSATGEMVGFSESEILAYATAMSSVGVTAEKGGTAVSKLLRKIQLAVETDGAELENYAGAAGMSIEEFKDLFQRDAVNAVTAFIDGIGDVERNGKSAIAVLNDMGIKEARMTDVILRLSSADNLLIDALETADQAWQENTALAIEANKRYETFESQLLLLKNSFINLGVAIYDNLTRSPVLSWITSLKEGVDEFTRTTLPNVVSKIKSTLPTIQRKLKPLWNIASMLFDGVKAGIKFIIDNSATIIGIIAGIGTALATYKIVSTITHIVESVKTLTANPVMLGLTAVITAIGALAGAFTAYKIAQQQATDDDLAAHFGNIALSMSEIESVARHIVGSNALTGLERSLEEFTKIDVLSDEVENAIEEINRMNWQVSIGMALTEEEGDAYKEAIQTYVDKVQEYALQARYAVSINLDTILTNENLEDSNIVNKIDKFYADKYNELEDIGKKLGSAVTSAFNDGLLEIDEINVIAGLQSQMAEIQRQLAVGELDAALALMSEKYTGSMLTSDSFQNLQSELAEKTADAVSVYEESYKKSYAAATAAYNGGYLTDAEYADAIKAAGDTINEDIASTLIRSIAFQINTISDSYGAEIEQFKSVIQNVVSKYSDPAFDFDWNYKPALLWNDMMMEIMRGGPSNESKRAVEELLSYMEDYIEKLNSLPELSDPALQKEVDATLKTVETLRALTARQDFAGGDFVGYVEALDDFLTTYDTVHSANVLTDFFDMPEDVEDPWWDVVEEVEKQEAETTASNIMTFFRQKLNEKLKEIKNILDVIDYRSSILVDFFPKYSGFNVFKPSNIIGSHANGGLVSNTELSWLAEKGPEMVVPLDGSRNAVSLWQKTGRLLDMQGSLDRYDVSSSGSSEIIYSPTLQFYGEAPSKEDLEDALSMSQDKFDTMMDKYIKNKRRTSFAL